MEPPSLCIAAIKDSKILLQLPILDRSKYTEGVASNTKWCNYDVTVSNGVNLCDPFSELTACGNNMRIRCVSDFFLTWVGSYKNHCSGINAHTFMLATCGMSPANSARSACWPCAGVWRANGTNWRRQASNECGNKRSGWNRTNRTCSSVTKRRCSRRAFTDLLGSQPPDCIRCMR